MSQFITPAWARGLAAATVCTAALPAWAQGLPPSFTGSRASDLGVPIWLNFSISLPPLWPLVWFAVGSLTAALLFHGAYRLTLRAYVQQGVHPRKVSNTLLLFMLTTVVLLGFLMLQSVGGGYYTVVLALGAAITLALVVMRAVLVGWVMMLAALTMAAILLRVFEIM